MIKQGTGGSIMFTASTSAHRVNYPQPQVGYNASKAAILQLKSSLAAEWARYGIRVNSISPGYMDTVLNEGPGLDVVKKIWLAKNPMGRMGDPRRVSSSDSDAVTEMICSEIAGVVILLCSPAGKYINGADLAVDGKSLFCRKACEGIDRLLNQAEHPCCSEGNGFVSKSIGLI